MSMKGWTGGAVQWDKHVAIDLTSDNHPCDSRCVGIYVGTAGDVVCKDRYGTEVTHVAVPAGIHQGRFLQITKAGTDADNLVELIYTGQK